jgi:glycosyltransferase involved in cell wall biosynthesis
VNLVILIGRFPPGPQGGAEYQAEAWARRLADRHRVTVVTRRESGLGGGGPLREARDGFGIVRLPASRVPVWRTLRDAARVEATVAALEPRPDLLLCFQTFVSGWIGVRLQRRLGIPAVVWVRGEGEYRFHGSAGQRLFNPPTWRSARGVLVQSEQGRADLLEAIGRLDPAARDAVAAHLDVVPNGLELPSAPGPVDPMGPVLTVGRLIANKGVDVVVRALAGSTGRLEIAGLGPECRRLEALARQVGTRAEFLGHLDHERLRERYAGAGCVVLAARRGEGLPNVLMEAMAWGRPVIATPVAGVHGLVADGVNGLIVPVDDVSALRGAIRRVTSEQGLASRLGAEARRTAEAHAWEVVRPRLESVLERWSLT